MNKFQLQQHRERQERVKQAIRLWKEDMQVSQIARKLGVADSTTEGYLLENGIDPYKTPELIKLAAPKIRRKRFPTNRTIVFMTIITCLFLILAFF